MARKAHLIDGCALSKLLRAEIVADVAAFSATASGRVPGLAVVLVGENPASQVYIRNKARKTVEVGMRSIRHKLPADTAQDALVELIERLNADDDIDGILVQLPLPDHIDPDRIINTIDPAKDVDGFHAANAGRLMIGRPNLVPCTPLGCMRLIEQAKQDLTLATISGLSALVIGRSNIVGKPMAQLLLAANCTVTIAHSRTQNLAEICRSADIMVAAVGQPEMIPGEWIKDGAIVIDVGINRVDMGDGNTKLVGDVVTEQASLRAAAITPVPGGVGPMTIACLLKNTLTAAQKRLPSEAK